MSSNYKWENYMPSWLPAKPIDYGHSVTVSDVRLAEPVERQSPMAFFCDDELSKGLKYDRKRPSEDLAIDGLKLARARALVDRYALNERPGHGRVHANPQQDGDSQS